jgi:hypothetical protein
MAAPFSAKKGEEEGYQLWGIAGRQCWEGRCAVGGGAGNGGTTKEEEQNGWQRKRKNMGRKANFSLALGSHFFSLRAWNPPLFIGGRRETLCLFWEQILVLDLNRKDLNHWLKVAIIDYQILTTQGCMS